MDGRMGNYLKCLRTSIQLNKTKSSQPQWMNLYALIPCLSKPLSPFFEWLTDPNWDYLLGGTILALTACFWDIQFRLPLPGSNYFLCMLLGRFYFKCSWELYYLYNELLEEQRNQVNEINLILSLPINRSSNGNRIPKERTQILVG
uniref:Mononegavirus-type SAM-dependent 2'-O-MTase domain-containing protein n=1 Tax=Picea glauca TaxID=3330 RepID=A0A101LWY4_PICGL|nr:hypothetical protein ABT39_MTgene6349 [Picea glauca]